MTIKSSHEKCLEKDRSVSIHHRNIHALTTEMYKVKSGYTTKREIGPYNLRTHSEFRGPLTRSVCHGRVSI